MRRGKDDSSRSMTEEALDPGSLSPGHRSAQVSGTSWDPNPGITAEMKLVVHRNKHQPKNIWGTTREGCENRTGCLRESNQLMGHHRLQCSNAPMSQGCLPSSFPRFLNRNRSAVKTHLISETCETNLGDAVEVRGGGDPEQAARYILLETSSMKTAHAGVHYNIPRGNMSSIVVDCRNDLH